MTGAELADWAAFERLHGPILIHERVDLGYAVVASVIANVNRDSKKRSRPWEVSDFLPKWGRPAPPPRQSAEQMIAALSPSLFRRKGE